MDSTPASEKTHYPALLALHTKRFGKGIKLYEPILSHGSDRLIIRVTSENDKTCIGIINENIAENRAFISFARHFRQKGLKVPRIFEVSEDMKSYLLEDLGDETLLKRINRTPGGFGSDKTALYKRVINELVKFQVTAGKDIDYSLCYQFNEFGGENIDFDLNYFRERFLNIFYKGELNEGLLRADLDHLKGKLLELPRDTFLYRDFQGRNIMLKHNDIYFIDFQSGRKGALLYDLASLLYNSKANIPQEIREDLIRYYLDVVSEQVNIDKDKYTKYFWYFAVIRILQALGAYGYLGIVKAKSSFLESVPIALKNIDFILNNRIDPAELKYLRGIVALLEGERTHAPSETVQHEEKIQPVEAALPAEQIQPKTVIQPVEKVQPKPVTEPENKVQPADKVQHETTEKSAEKNEDRKSEPKRMKKHTIRGLNVIEYGEDNRQAIVFIHAFPLCSRMWDKQVDAFQSSYRVVVYDLRSFGYSELGDGHFTIDTHVSDLISITDSLKLEKPIVCGLSMGGYVLLRALELYQSKFKGAILADTKAEADNNPTKLARAEQIKMIKGGQREQFTDNFIKAALSETNYTEKPELVEFLKKMIGWQKNETITGGLLTLAARTDTTEFLERLDVKTLVLVGKDDRLTPPEFSKLIYGKTKNSDIKIISNSGHLSNMENPEEFNAAVLAFLKSYEKNK